MIGELDYQTTFIDTLDVTNDENGNPKNPFGPQAQVFLHAFVLLMAIVLMNLLVGGFFTVETNCSDEGLTLETSSR